MCTRIFNSQNKALPVTGRNMDWYWQLSSSLYAFPRGLKRQGVDQTYADVNRFRENGIEIFEWTSIYSSIVTVLEYPSSKVSYAAADGMNEKGLVANALYDGETVFPDETTSSKPRLSILRLVQYLLDTCTSVEKSIEAIESKQYLLIAEEMPDSSAVPPVMHICLSDVSGDSAIVEFRGEKVCIYHSHEYRVATNEPSYDGQLILNEYWRFQTGLSEIKNPMPSIMAAPGGASAVQRFERASYYLNFSLPEEEDYLAVAQTRSIMGMCSQPISFDMRMMSRETTDAKPRTSRTIWTNLADHEGLKYYVANSQTMNAFYLEIDAIGTETKRVFIMEDSSVHHTARNNTASGNVADQLEPSNDPFGKTLVIRS
ncbi:linear amide C-N hydrolase [Alteromonas gracilis]|uniref:linear amide C-N hydrolase n=1 Tax=Alteromonas gracilis TaxID=1479524 RepID=UPI003735DE0B